MARTKAQVEIEKELIKEVKALSKEVRKMKDMEYIKVLKHPFKLMGLSLLKGMMIGLGSVLGASVLVALAIYLIAQISFVPILGDFVEDVINQIQSVTPSNGEDSDKSGFMDKYNETKKNIEGNEDLT